MGTRSPRCPVWSGPGADPLTLGKPLFSLRFSPLGRGQQRGLPHGWPTSWVAPRGGGVTLPCRPRQGWGRPLAAWRRRSGSSPPAAGNFHGPAVGTFTASSVAVLSLERACEWQLTPVQSPQPCGWDLCCCWAWRRHT